MATDTNFEVSKALHAKQVAYDEMAKARSKMSSLLQAMTQKYLEVGRLQADFDAARYQQDEDWKEYNKRQLGMKAEIGQKIECVKECNALQENFGLMADNPEEDPGKAEAYSEGAKFFSMLALQKIVERDNLIATKRAMPRPDTYASRQILANLKVARGEHRELLESYHAAKNEFSLKKKNFDRLNERYHRLCNGEDDPSDDTYTNIPQKLERDEGLLLEAKVPEEYWDNCKLERRADGRIDVYYGGDEETEHGHVVVFNGQIEYARLPQSKTVLV